jgi:predicted DNA-binding protein YlxM (UPF0122 family)
MDRVEHKPTATELWELYELEGKSMPEIAKLYNVSYTSVHRWVTKAGLTVRPPEGRCRTPMSNTVIEHQAKLRALAEMQKIVQAQIEEAIAAARHSDVPWNCIAAALGTSETTAARWADSVTES